MTTDRRAVADGPGNSTGRLRSLWMFLIIVLVVGLALAIGADSDRGVFAEEDGRLSEYLDAIREIGGALVAGAAVAVPVLWFELRREQERVTREETRDTQMAVAAWTRDLQLRLFEAVHTDLRAERELWVAFVRVEGPRSHRLGGIGPILIKGKFQHCVYLADSLITVQREGEVLTKFNEWQRSTDVISKGARGMEAQQLEPLLNEERLRWEALVHSVERLVGRSATDPA